GDHALGTVLRGRRVVHGWSHHRVAAAAVVAAAGEREGEKRDAECEKVRSHRVLLAWIFALPRRGAAKRRSLRVSYCPGRAVCVFHNSRADPKQSRTHATARRLCNTPRGRDFHRERGARRRVDTENSTVSTRSRRVSDGAHAPRPATPSLVQRLHA